MAREPQRARRWKKKRQREHCNRKHVSCSSEKNEDGQWRKKKKTKHLHSLDGSSAHTHTPSYDDEHINESSSSMPYHLCSAYDGVCRAGISYFFFFFTDGAVAHTRMRKHTKVEEKKKNSSNGNNATWSEYRFRGNEFGMTENFDESFVWRPIRLSVTAMTTAPTGDTTS